MNATLQIHTLSYGGPFGVQYNLLAECISCQQWMVVQAFTTLYHDRETPDRIPSTTPGADPPRDARDSGSARSHSMHLETSSSDRP